MTVIHELRAIAARAAGIGAQVLIDKMDEIRQIDYKGRVDLVTDADHRSEELVVDFLARECPDHGIVGEEGTARNPAAAYQWHVDPLDGTTNYAHGLPIFATSVGVAHHGAMVAGAVIGPALGETYLAGQGLGATLNDKPIRVSKVDELIRSLLVTGFPYDPAPGLDNLDHFADFMYKCQAVRRLGSAALDLCWVAGGRFEGFWEKGISSWDMAAGSLIVAEAGGRLSNVAGGEFDLSARQIVATNGLVHDQIIAVLSDRVRQRGR